MPRRLTALLLPLLAMLMSATTTHAQFGPGGNQVQASLIAETQTAQPGEPITVGVRLTIEYPWHVYWTNPEGDGMTPEVVWDLPEGVAISGPRWPAPQTFKFLGATQFGYENEVVLLYELTPPADAAGELDLKASASWLACDQENCVPGDATLSLTLPISDAAPQPSAEAVTLQKAEAKVPRAIDGWSFAAERTDNGYTLIIEAPSVDAAQALSGLYYFSQDKYVVEPAAEQAVTVEGNTIKLSLANRTTDPYGSEIKRDQPVTLLNGVLTAESGFGDSNAIAMPVRASFDGSTVPPTQDNPGPDNRDPAEASTGTAAAAESGQSVTFFAAIGLALLGGVILNLMPCVFPVLSIKILGFVQQAGENPAIVRRHGYAFAGGVMISFWALVAVLLILRAAASSATGDASSVSWGFQLQNPTFVLGMIVLVFLIGLNLIGAFEVGVGLSAAAGKASQSVNKDGYGKSFFTGVLATLIATPCTGPFMAPALGAALAMPPIQAIIVFTALGVGMATPYVLLSCFPKLLEYLPRPGAWMESFKQAMAFPMFATAGVGVYIYSKLTDSSMVWVLMIALSVIAMGAWIYGRWSLPTRLPRTKWIARVAALVLVVGGTAFTAVKANQIEQERLDKIAKIEAGEYVVDWLAFTPDKVKALQAEGRPVLVDFTATWCAICQTNKVTSLRTDTANTLYEDYNVALFEADYTRKDPMIGKVLEQYQRGGVPLYLVFPADGGEPQILPNTLTPGIVEGAIKQAAGKQSSTDTASKAEPAENAQDDSISTTEYSAETVEQLRNQGQTVLVDVYANWHPLSQSNQPLLHNSNAIQLMQQYNVALISADITEEITQEISLLLSRHDRAGVPLSVVFPPTALGREPIVLPKQITIADLEMALQASSGISIGLSQTEPRSYR